MRLIDTTTLKLREFTAYTTSDYPKYAVLSHTWGAEEVTFQDMITEPLPSEKRGFAKIKATCELARIHGLNFAWVDTCCIDKSSSAELTEAINSMYAWYRASETCYAFLEDLESTTEISASSDFAKCRWFTRGWTLQELIAPTDLKFYDKNWVYRGSKHDLAVTLKGITRIPIGILKREQELTTKSVAQRMSWAAFRETTRIEDEAYCLLGIFGIHMPLIYGEGFQAFQRLQQEIVKSIGDMTILAWGSVQGGQGSSEGLQGLFAPSPDAFWIPGVINCLPSLPDITITTRGLRVSRNTWMPLWIHGTTYYLIVGAFSPWTERVSTMQSSSVSALRLSKIGPGIFLRTGLDTEVPVDALYAQHHQSEYYLLTDIPSQINDIYVGYRKHSLHVEVNKTFHVEDAVPHSLWDDADKIFLRESAWQPHARIHYNVVLGVRFKGIGDFSAIEVVVLLDLSSHLPSLIIFQASQAPRLVSKLFGPMSKEHSMMLADLEHLNDSETSLESFVTVSTDRGPARITPVLTETEDVFLSSEEEGSAIPVANLQLQIPDIGDSADSQLVTGEK
ncbi:Putative Vegetative incompatibility protein HET [Podospora comata]|uniref:Vegetative incompatibility protein HET n=1 Tax=Podospora comata TaxID=48703 RepID=A0ABY6S9Z0_PODCO|nr:Putative Vegetative incompatibility protein HET [Podospora comata]